MKTRHQAKRPNEFGQWQLVIPAPALFVRSKRDVKSRASKIRHNSRSASHRASKRAISPGMNWGNSTDAQL